MLRLFLRRLSSCSICRRLSLRRRFSSPGHRARMTTSAFRSMPLAATSGGKKVLRGSVIQATGSSSLCASSTRRKLKVKTALRGPPESSASRPRKFSKLQTALLRFLSGRSPEKSFAGRMPVVLARESSLAASIRECAPCIETSRSGETWTRFRG